MEKRDGLRLMRALTAQLERRLPMMKAEALLAEKLIPAFPPTLVPPPPWVLAACRIGGRSIMRQVFPVPHDVQAKEIGGLVGLASTWKAFLSQPNEDLQGLEKDVPELASFRERFLKMSEPTTQASETIESLVPTLPVTAQEIAAFNKGRAAGSAAIVDDEGELRGQDSIKEETCYFIWLYWEQVAKLGSTAELMKFLREFRVEGLTKQNLEKICREIGLRFKARGRPKNLLPKKRSR